MTPLDHARELIALREKAFKGEWWASSKADGPAANNNNILWRNEEGDVCVILQDNHWFTPNGNRDFVAHAANHAAGIAAALIEAEAKIARMEASHAEDAK